MVLLLQSIKRVQRKTTWEVLSEVDQLMSHIPEWKSFDWTMEDQLRKLNYQYNPTKKKIRKRQSNGRF
jgi:hypothetical protein